MVSSSMRDLEIVFFRPGSERWAAWLDPAVDVVLGLTLPSVGQVVACPGVFGTRVFPRHEWMRGVHDVESYRIGTWIPLDVWQVFSRRKVSGLPWEWGRDVRLRAILGLDVDRQIVEWTLPKMRTAEMLRSACRSGESVIRVHRRG